MPEKMTLADFISDFLNSQPKEYLVRALLDFEMSGFGTMSFYEYWTDVATDCDVELVNFEEPPPDDETGWLPGDDDDE